MVICPEGLMHDTKYMRRHDANYCITCDKWLDPQCGCEDCLICIDRPNKPSKVKNPNDYPEHPKQSRPLQGYPEAQETLVPEPLIECPNCEKFLKGYESLRAHLIKDHPDCYFLSTN